MTILSPPFSPLTKLGRLDEMVARLREAAPRFVRLSLTDRITLAKSMQIHQRSQLPVGVLLGKRPASE